MRALKRSNLSWLAGGTAIFAAAFILDLSYGFSTQDESWFLQVVDRCASGQVLYRDVFFGAGPLPVYITVVLAKFFGTQILVVKAVMALCFTATALVMAYICRRLDRDFHPPLLVLALLALMPPWRPGAGVPYSPFAALLLLASLAVMLTWAISSSGPQKLPAVNPQPHEADDSQRQPPASLIRSERLKLAAAGALAGLAFASKQDVGIYCLALLLLTVSGITLLDRASAKLLFARLQVSLAAFLLALLVTLLPVFIAGGGGGYIDYGFANKGKYVEYGQISYAIGVDQLNQNLSTALSFGEWSAVYSLFLYLLPFLVFPALVLTWLLAPEQRRRTTIITAYAGAGFASIFPRPDESHLAYAVPGLLIGAYWVWHLLAARLPAMGRIAMRAVLWSWLFLGLAFVASASLLSWGGKISSPFPHFGGTSIEADKATALEKRVQVAQTAAAGRQSLFILSHDAGFLYLAGGLTNPTPYDYPVASAFGSHGEQDVITAISEGRIREVLLDTNSTYSSMKAAALEDYIIGNMTPGQPDAGFLLFSAKA